MTRPGNGPYAPSYADGRYQFSVAISTELEKQLEIRLVREKVNRTQWIRAAITEKLERDNGR